MTKRPDIAIDLSALDEPWRDTVSDGKPLEKALADIEEDAEQPRTEFDPAALEELAASIVLYGVKQPISVREHPDKKGKWIINFGARRFRASLLAGKTTIPAFVDETSNSYIQVIENEQRDNLKPMELALFVSKQIQAGESKSEIAEKLGKKSNSFITYLLALIDPPACIEKIYRDGRCVSVQALYKLRGLHETHAEQVEKWCADAGNEITNTSVSNFGHWLKNPPSIPTTDLPESENTNQEIKAGIKETDSVGFDDYNNDPQQDDAGMVMGNVTTLPFHNSDIEKETKAPTPPDPNKIKKPLLLVEYKGRAAMMLLNRRPSEVGLVWIKYEDGSGEDEVDIAKCKNNLLTEASR